MLLEEAEGILAILEFSMPGRWPFRTIYRWYFERILPRHLEIIYAINKRFLDTVEPALQSRVSLVGENGERRIRMAHLAFVGSRRVNGVSRVHTQLLKSTVFADLHRIAPSKIVNVTNDGYGKLKAIVVVRLKGLGKFCSSMYAAG